MLQCLNCHRVSSDDPIKRNAIVKCCVVKIQEEIITGTIYGYQQAGKELKERMLLLEHG